MGAVDRIKAMQREARAAHKRDLAAQRKREADQMKPLPITRTYTGRKQERT